MSLINRRECGLRQHLQMMSRFIDSTARGAQLSMILRSPDSDPAKALVGMKGALERIGASARVILTRLEPESDLKQLFASLCELAPQSPSRELIRWARNPRLLDAHEQVTYGDTACWAGDAMRRDADKRNALAILDDGAAEAVTFGQRAFAALWRCSVEVPERRLIGPASARPFGAYEQVTDPAVDPVALPPMPQGWPLVRH